MLAFHNDPVLKKLQCDRMQFHQQRRLLIRYNVWMKGFYRNHSKYPEDARDYIRYGHHTNKPDYYDFRGPYTGSPQNIISHGKSSEFFEKYVGLPIPLIFIMDSLFFGLPSDKCMDWPRNFLAHIKVGSDLTYVADKLIMCLLAQKDNEPLCLYPVFKPFLEKQEHIDEILVLYRRKTEGDIPSWTEWNDLAKKIEAGLPYTCYVHWLVRCCRLQTDILAGKSGYELGEYYSSILGNIIHQIPEKRRSLGWYVCSQLLLEVMKSIPEGTKEGIATKAREKVMYLNNEQGMNCNWVIINESYSTFSTESAHDKAVRHDADYRRELENNQRNHAAWYDSLEASKNDPGWPNP